MLSIIIKLINCPTKDDRDEDCYYLKSPFSQKIITFKNEEYEKQTKIIKISFKVIFNEEKHDVNYFFKL